MVRFQGRSLAGCRCLAIILFAIALCGAISGTWLGAAAQSATPAAVLGNPCLDDGTLSNLQNPDSPIYDYVVLLDVSGSMEGYLDGGGRDLTKNIMPEVKASLKQYLSELQPGSQVTIIPFTGEIDTDAVFRLSIGDTSDPGGDLVAAAAYIDGLLAGQTGGTHITDAISYGLDQLDRSRADDRQHIQTMLLFTDGEGNGASDVDENNDFIVDNLLDAIGEYKQEQPYLFVKYVSLGVAVPDAEEMEQRGVDVVETVEGVPPVREVRVTIVPDQIRDLKPGIAETNRLCATSGELADGLEVVVNDDPAELPADVQIAFRSDGNILTEDGLPLTYTLAGEPTSRLGPYITYVEVKSADPEVLINPSRLPVTITLADPTPAVTLDVGEFPAVTRTRGAGGTDEVLTLPLSLSAPEGGAAELALDSENLLEVVPGAHLSFVAGEEELGDTATLSQEQPVLGLRLTVPSADIDALSDGAHTLPITVIAAPSDAEVTITGADATLQAGDAQRVIVGAPLTLNPQPVCGVDVAPVPAQVLLEGNSSTEPVRWETFVTLTGRDGCAGTLTFDDSTLQQAIPGARASFEVNETSPLQLELGDTPARITLAVTAPHAAVLELGVGDHPQNVDLIAGLSVELLSPPDGLTPTGTGDYVIPVTLPLTIGDRPGAVCTLPTFAPQEIVADGATSPDLTASGEVTCSFAGDLPVTLRVGGQDEGVTTTLHAVDATPGRSVTLDQDHPSATVTLEVERSIAQATEGTHAFTAQIQAQTSARNADLELDGKTVASEGSVSSTVELRVDVAGEKVISIAPFALSPEPAEITTFDTEPDPLEWHSELDIDLSNGATGTLQIDLPLNAPVSAFFKVGDTTLPGPVQLAGQSEPLELVVQLPLTAAHELPQGLQRFDVPLTLDPQGARVDAAGFARDDSLFRGTALATLQVITPPVADVGKVTLPPAAVSNSDDANDQVRIASDPIPIDLQNGGRAHLAVDDTALANDYDGASAGFSVGNSEPQPSVTLDQIGEPVRLVILIPRDALTEEGPQVIPAVSFTAEGAGDGVVLTQDGVPVPGGQTSTADVTPEVVVTVPGVTLDPGTWRPEVLSVPVNGDGTGEQTWERTVSLNNRQDGANPGVTLTPDDPEMTARLYDGEIGEDTLLAEGEPGQPASAIFPPGHDRIVAVVSVPEADLRGLGLRVGPAFPGLGASERHTLPVALSIDPRGSKVTTADGAELREPETFRAPVTAELVDPRSNLIFGIPLLVVLLLAAIWALWPALPKDAAILVEGDSEPTPVSSGAMIGPGMDINVPSNGMFGTLRGAVGGRITGNAKFIAGDTSITYQEEPIESGKSRVIHRDDDLTDAESNTRITYTRAEEPTLYGDDGSGDESY